MSIWANFLIAYGYTGQTTEVLALPNEPTPFERVVGVPLKSYVALSHHGTGKGEIRRFGFTK